jgi:hypothetical protein
MPKVYSGYGELPPKSGKNRDSAFRQRMFKSVYVRTISEAW